MRGGGGGSSGPGGSCPEAAAQQQYAEGAGPSSPQRGALCGTAPLVTLSRGLPDSYKGFVSSSQKRIVE